MGVHRHILERIDEARAEQRVGVILAQNVDDFCVGQRPFRLIPYAVVQHLALQGFHTATVSLAEGITCLSPSGVELGASPFDEVHPTEQPADLLRGLTPLLRDRSRRVAILVRHASHLAPTAGELGASALQLAALAGAEILYEWSTDEKIRSAGNFVVLCDPEEQLHDLIARQTWGYKRIRVGYPTAPDRESFIRACLKHDSRYGPLEDSLDCEGLAVTTGGLALTEIEALLRGAHASGQPLTRELVRRERATKISERLRDLAEVKEPSIGWEGVAGLSNVKAHFCSVADAARRGPGALSGSTLLAGIPGVGKSHTASALARELGVPIIFVRNLFHGLVGGSEARVERLIQTCEAFDGAVVVFEEVDQLLGRRSESGSLDSGTSQRVLGRLMEFMGGGYPGLHFVGLTNRPDLLDYSISDRFGVLIPVLHPTEGEVAELLPVLARQIGRRLARDVNCAELSKVPSLRGVSVRSLLVVLQKAGELADTTAGKRVEEIGAAHLERVACMYQPTMDPVEAEFVALTAIAGCQFSAYLPWMSWEGLRKDASIPAYLEGIVDPRDGRVDVAKLRSRLGELRALRAARS